MFQIRHSLMKEGVWGYIDDFLDIEAGQSQDSSMKTIDSHPGAHRTSIPRFTIHKVTIIEGGEVQIKEVDQSLLDQE
jgi:hypothetical protein